MSSVTIEVRGAAELAAKFGNYGARMRILATAMDGVEAVIQGAVVPLTPVGVTSNLRGSWASETLVEGSSVLGFVGSPLAYSGVVEDGRTAGATMPPPDAIATWVSRKLGPDVSPFVVARSIGRKGTKGVLMLRKAVDGTRGVWTAIVDSAVARLVVES